MLGKAASLNNPSISVGTYGNSNVRELMKRMEDLVGMNLEMTDEIGKQLTYAVLKKQGMPRHDFPELIAPTARTRS